MSSSRQAMRFDVDLPQFDQYSQHYGLGILTRSIERTLSTFHNSSDATLVPPLSCTTS